MKKKQLLTLVCVLGWALTAHAQFEPMRSEIKTNALAFAFGEINILYEIPVRKYTGANFFVGHLFSDNSSQSGWGNWTYAGGSYRFYKEENQHGLFFGPFLKYRVQYATRDLLVLDPITLESNRTTVRNYDSNFYVGMEVGKKGSFNSTLLYEVFLGAGRPLARWNSSGFNAENEFGELAHYRLGILLNYRRPK